LNPHKKAKEQRLMRELNPAHIESLIAIINQAPYFKLLSMAVKELGVGFSVVEVDIENKHNHPFGGVHGGVYCSIIDTAAFWSAYGEADENSGLITLDVNVNFLAPVMDSKLIIKGRCIKTGKTICMTDATATTRTGKIIAAGTSKLLTSYDLPSIPKALNLASERELPPKFIEKDDHCK
jgi:uncharacterized protein (TIGR00369 family)